MSDNLDNNITPASIISGDFDPYDHADNWHCELVEPSGSVMNEPALLDPFADPQTDWKERESQMINLMHDHHGLGLAAPQIGSSHRMFVMAHSQLGDIGVYNPDIVSYSDTDVMWQEGCLSFPLLFLSIKRPEEITAQFTRSDGHTKIELTMSGRDARIFQHEYDHLQGSMFLDKVSLLKINRAKAQRSKLIKKFKKAHKQQT